MPKLVQRPHQAACALNSTKLRLGDGFSQGGGHTPIGRGEANAQPGNSTGRLGDDFMSVG